MGWVVLVPLCTILVVFTLANRQPVVLNFNPFVQAEQSAAPGFGVPLFLVLYIVLLIGVLLGGVAAWFAQGVQRQKLRHWRREAHALDGEIEALRKQHQQTPLSDLSEVDDGLERR